MGRTQTVPVPVLTPKEIDDVLHRLAICKTFPRLSDDFLEHLADKGHTIEDVPIAFRYPRDPDDEP